MDREKTHLYLMPGMAANSSIFEHLALPETQFQLHRLEWFVPDQDMSLSAYALKMAKNIKHKNPVLLGVSFGGILVQEIAKVITVRKVIVVSSVKHTSELPKRMVFAKYTKVHKLLPTGLVNNMDLLAKYAFGEIVNKRLELYEQYLSIRDKYYLDWSLDQIIHWRQSEFPDNLIHIHGEKDSVFPISHIKNCIHVKNGTHTMIIHRAKWFNEHLPAIIMG